MNDYIYKVTLIGGKLNGAERYYDTKWKAEQQAKRYITSQERKGLELSEHLWAEIIQINKYTGEKEQLYYIEP